MGFNFPNAPISGDSYTPAGGPTFTWDGIAWKALVQGVPVTVSTGDTPPSSPALGQLWWESDTGNMFIWYQDADSSQWVQVNGSAATGARRGWIAGLALSTAGSSTSFSVAAGEAIDSTNINLMALAATLTKTTAAWAVGTGNGGLDTGAIAASTWYHAHLIKRTDTNVVDALVSLSATAPTLPASYTLFRRIGSMKTNASSQWIAFTQNGDEFNWITTVIDVNGSAISTAPVSLSLTVPAGIVVSALFSGMTSNTGANSIYFYSLDRGVQTAGAGAANISLTFNAASQVAGHFNIKTNTSAQIGVVAQFAGLTSFWLGTYGWVDRRGRDA